MSCDQCDGDQEEDGPATYETIVTQPRGQAAGGRDWLSRNVSLWSERSRVRVAGHLNMAPMR
ncbi:hypothetical protein BEP68_16280 [Microbacterium sp. 4-7]|nr:hypothetical protein NS234_07130 [Microbacterium oxydans]MBC6496381.1 hypothetical protein [Microbacterium sp. 4-7]